jgi:hypothetical protein
MAVKQVKQFTILMKYLCLLFFVAASSTLFAADIDLRLFTGKHPLVADTDTIIRKQVNFGRGKLWQRCAVFWPYRPG